VLRNNCAAETHGVDAGEYRHRAADCRLELLCAPLALRVSTDVTLLERMLRNLIGNALRGDVSV
jgi:signal transduction histidine kinase